MALQVWLPLNGNLNNQGLNNTTFTGSTTFEAGKIGQAGVFGTNAKRAISSATVTLNSQVTIAFWIKIKTWVNWGRIFNLYNSDKTNAIGCVSNTSTDKRIGTQVYKNGTNLTDSYNGSFDLNTWYHFTMVINGTTKQHYINGSLVGTATLSDSMVTTDYTIMCGGTADNGAPVDMDINDFRVYDHALSPKEIEILSRGLVCHYPLCDNSIQTSNVSNTSTTFNTSNADGGWSHWGQSGHKGSCGQTTSSTYIYTSGQTYAHRVTNASGATGNYLMFQSPSFSATGGYRSMSAIIKEVNGNKITDAICYPVWNGAADDKPYVWDIVSPLGNGFYLCKVESFQQDGTNNLVGIYVKPGKEIYVTNCYIENDRQACSDFIFGTSTTVYDCSGFQNNMIASGTVSCNVDSARYSKSTHFINGSYLMATQNSPTYLPTDGLTVNIWVKPTTWGTPISCTEGGGWNIELSTNGLQFQCYISSVGYKGAASTVKASDLIDGKWHMLTGTFDRIAQQTKFYIDGELKGTNSTGSSNGVGYANNRLIISGEAQTTTPTSSTFVGEESDVRIYATALSATQIKELYNTAVSVANNGTLLGYELVEV